MRTFQRLLAVLLMSLIAACAATSKDVTITVAPSQHTLLPLETHAFTATVTGTQNTDVTWHSTAGTVTGTGTTIDYTAPASAGSYELSATSVADTSRTATAAITVTTAPAPPGAVKLLAGDGAEGDLFGYDVAMDGSVLVVGAPKCDTAATDAGAAYVFTRAGGTWQEQARLTATDPVADAQFGWSVALSGDTIAVGNAAEPRGAVYVYISDNGSWTFQQKIVAADATNEDNFGRALALEGDTLVIGADRYDASVPDAGAAYVFTRAGATWTQQAKLVASDGAFNERFGYAIDLSGAMAVIGAYGNEGRGPLTGYAYVFLEDAGTWSQQQKLVTMPYVDGDRFGQAVAVDGDTIAVGARLDDFTEKDSGSVHLFTRTGTVWSRLTRLAASDQAADGEFGYKIALDADTLVASRIATPARVYIFRAASGTWTETDHVSIAGSAFGNALDLSGTTLLAGAFLDSELGTRAGSAYVIELGP